jgi:tungstate transport system substrate-binding protein
MFEARYPYDVDLRVSNSAQAIQEARNGECDATLTSNPTEEVLVTNFMLTVNKQDVMHDQLVIAGPPPDPAGIRGSEGPVEAFRRIKEAQAPFASRGDGSDLNAAEQEIWGTVTGESEPGGLWYLRSGKGMSDTLLFAGERGAYVLTDKATFLVYGEQAGLEILVEGGDELVERYVVMEVNPAAFPDVNSAGAQAFSEFVTGLEAQGLLEGFGVEEYGEQLFYPDSL